MTIYFGRIPLYKMASPTSMESSLSKQKGKVEPGIYNVYKLEACNSAPMKRLFGLLNTWRKNALYCDVTVSINQENFHLHRCVLAAGSKKLHSILHSIGPTSMAFVSLDGMPVHSFCQVVDYLYTGKLCFGHDKIRDLQKTARFLEVEEVEKLCRLLQFAPHIAEADARLQVIVFPRKQTGIDLEESKVFFYVKEVKSSKPKDARGKEVKKNTYPSYVPRSQMNVKQSRKENMHYLDDGTSDVSTENSALIVIDEEEDDMDDVDCNTGSAKSSSAEREPQYQWMSTPVAPSGEERMNLIEIVPDFTEKSELGLDNSDRTIVKPGGNSTEDQEYSISIDMKSDSLTLENVESIRGETTPSPELDLNKIVPIFHLPSGKADLPCQEEGASKKDAADGECVQAYSDIVVQTIKKRNAVAKKSTGTRKRIRPKVPVFDAETDEASCSKDLNVDTMLNNIEQEEYGEVNAVDINSSGETTGPNGPISRSESRQGHILDSDSDADLEADDQGEQDDSIDRHNFADLCFEGEVDYDKDEFFECPECKLVYRGTHAYKLHMLSKHNVKRPYYCKYPNCTYKGDRPSSLRRHMGSHSDEKTAKCPHCDKALKSKGCLHSHLRSCLQKRNYLCDHCGMKFNHMPGLVIHRRLHTGERPFTCDECDRTFTDYRNFKRHRRIHDNVMPYECEVCKKRFRYSNVYKDHLRKHDPSLVPTVALQKPV